jgi:hypothetical protein
MGLNLNVELDNLHHTIRKLLSFPTYVTFDTVCRERLQGFSIEDFSKFNLQI